MIVLMDTRTDVKRKSKRPFWSKMVYRGELMQHAEARSSVVMSHKVMLGDTDVCHLGEGGVKCRSLSKQSHNNAADAPRVLTRDGFQISHMWHYLD